MSQTKGRVIAVRQAGPDHQVITVEGARADIYRREPCPKCPWRCDAVGEFPAEAFRHSANTAFDMATNTFACHSNGVEKTAVCAGFLLRNSLNNFGVRMMLMRGKLAMEHVQDGGHVLFDSYRAMAIANGVSPDDPAIAQCRADFE